MTPTLTGIRTALQNLAVKKGRPDYELCTAKQVKHALSNGLEHHLIAELPFFEVLPREEDKPSKLTKPTGQRGCITDAQALEVVTWLKNFDGLYKDLVKMICCDCSTLTNIKAGRRKVTLAMYNKIMKARKELEGMAV